ncbi:MAG: bifunctional DNA-formamidopyrimidine glycosylase/DNA-(apurinic or apyrimidinic site) lyase [Alphaproteobacteria bacterium]|nr:MAG: bifunctional DNA-formamidopyrimidine glycosylase/DNA-(apurinic or apyrimidinic site) lyase [Alphaproteobacteria bacterium]
MPELPEVETVRRGLVPVLEGARLAQVIVRRADLRYPLPPGLAEALRGCRIERLDRRGKYLLAFTDRETVLLVHLGMSGRILVSARTLGQFHRGGAAADRHDHVILETEDGARVVYNDARRFGAMDLCAADRIGSHPWLAALGPEPLGNAFGGACLEAAFRGRRAPVKTALLDQRIVAGLGNIYVCEALHRAGIAPTRAAGRISAKRLDRLAAAIRDVLRDAIAAGGSSLRDYRRADGELGYFQHAFRVYDREGAPCPAEGCAGRVRRIVQAGRSTYHCPVCQR